MKLTLLSPPTVVIVVFMWWWWCFFLQVWISFILPHRLLERVRRVIQGVFGLIPLLLLYTTASPLSTSHPITSLAFLNSLSRPLTSKSGCSSLWRSEHWLLQTNKRSARACQTHWRISVCSGRTVWCFFLSLDDTEDRGSFIKFLQSCTN